MYICIIPLSLDTNIWGWMEGYSQGFLWEVAVSKLPWCAGWKAYLHTAPWSFRKHLSPLQRSFLCGIDGCCRCKLSICLCECRQSGQDFRWWSFCSLKPSQSHGWRPSKCSSASTPALEQHHDATRLLRMMPFPFDLTCKSHTRTESWIMTRESPTIASQELGELLKMPLAF